jgi:hypothetical protein
LETRSQNTHQSVGEPPLPKAFLQLAAKPSGQQLIEVGCPMSTLDMVEKKKPRSSKASDQWCQKHDEVVFKKHELAEQQAAEVAAHKIPQDATAGGLVVPDTALSNGARQ